VNRRTFCPPQRWGSHSAGMIGTRCAPSDDAASSRAGLLSERASGGRRWHPQHKSQSYRTQERMRNKPHQSRDVAGQLAGLCVLQAVEQLLSVAPSVIVCYTHHAKQRLHCHCHRYHRDNVFLFP
jgi:hypothetical protein